MRRLIQFLILTSAALACRNASPSSISAVPAPSDTPSADETIGGGGAGDVLVDVEFGAPLTVWIRGEGPFRFGFDTGQSVGVLVSPEFADRLALPVVDRVDASDGTSSFPVDVVRIDSVQVGDIDLGRQSSIVVQPGSDVDGTLGFPAFSGLLVELDYIAGRLRIRRGALPVPDGRTILAVTSLGGIPMIPITIGHESARAVLDSGSETDLLVPLSMADRLTLDGPLRPGGWMKTPFGKFELQTARLKGSVVLGGLELVDPELTMSDHFNDVNVGGRFLSRFRVTFDPARGRVQFEV